MRRLMQIVRRSVLSRSVTSTTFAMVLAAAAVSAQGQIATLTSAGPFQLRGAPVTTDLGVPSWPAMAGDTIQAGQTPLTVTFADGSTIVLAPGSAARLSVSDETPVLQLETGSAHYTLKTASSVRLLDRTGALASTALIGDVAAATLPTGWWTAGHTTAVVAVGSGAGLAAFGIAKDKPPTSCSSSTNPKCK